MIRLAAAYTALNIPFWIYGHWFFISRPWFNIDLMVPLVVASRFRFWAAGALVGAWAIDLLVSQSLTYHFLSPLEFTRSATFFSSLNGRELLSWSQLTLFLLLALGAIAANTLRPQTKLPWRGGMVIVALLTFVDWGNGSSMFSLRATRIVPFNIAGSPGVTLAKRLSTEPKASELRPLPPAASAVGSARLLTWSKSNVSGSVLLVIVESWGLHKDTKVQAWLRSQVLSDAVLERFEARESTIAFAGSTTSAELRELCSRSGSYRRIDSVSGHDCVPFQFARSGWRTVGLHGFSASMFDRSHWWPLIGLQEKLFAEDLALPGSAICGGAFAGVCDKALIADAFEQAAIPQSFVYALTLNSHLPIERIEIPPDLRTLCQSTAISTDDCQLVATIGIVMRSVRVGLISSHSPIAVALVGDHAPPFSKMIDRSRYDPTRVPSLLLLPRK